MRVANNALKPSDFFFFIPRHSLRSFVTGRNWISRVSRITPLCACHTQRPRWCRKYLPKRTWDYSLPERSNPSAFVSVDTYLTTTLQYFRAQ